MAKRWDTIVRAHPARTSAEVGLRKAGEANGQADRRHIEARISDAAQRFIKVNWSGVQFVNGVATGVAQSIQSGSSSGGTDQVWQTVSYTYDPSGNGSGTVTYPETDSGGSPVVATYTYGGPEVYFDDPRFPGPMTKLRYTYYGTPCTEWGYWSPVNYRPMFYSKYEERNGVTDEMVARWEFACFAPGTPTGSMVGVIVHNQGRYETRGDGASRTLYFGTSSSIQDPNPDPIQYNGTYAIPPTYGFGGTSQLAKVTDWTNNTNIADLFLYSNAAEPSRVYDALNHRTQVTRDNRSAKILTETYADGGVRTWSYVDPANPSGDAIESYLPRFVYRYTDELGNQTSYKRDSVYRVYEIDHAGGTVETFSYNAFGQVLTHTLPSGAVDTRVYDARGLLQTVSNNVETTIDQNDFLAYTYYGTGNHPEWSDLVATVCDGRARAAGKTFSAKMEYNGRHQVTKVTYPSTSGGADPFVTYAYDKYGNCTAITDELGHQRTYTFDEFRRCTSYTEPLNAPSWNGTTTVASRTWNWYYDRFYLHGSTWVGYAASTHTNPQWRYMVGPAFNAAGDRRGVVRYFDVNNRIIQEQTGYTLSAQGVWSMAVDGETHYFGYDLVGNKTTSTDPLGRVTSTGYDVRNRPVQVIDPIGNLTTTSYDLAGNKVMVTLPDNNTQKWQNYDPFGQAARFIDERNDPTDLVYQWGPMKKLAKVTTYRDKDTGGTENQVTTFGWDGIGRAVSTTFPDNSTELTTYRHGAIETWKNRSGSIKQLNFANSYDARGRETFHSWTDGTPGISRAWDDAGRMLSIANINSTINYTYDFAGQAVTESQLVTGDPTGPFTLTYWRYPDGAVAHLLAPGGYRVRHDYTARGQLSKVGTDDASSNWLVTAAQYAYLQDGKPQTITHGNGLQTGYTYDGKGNIYSLQVYVASHPFLFAPNATVLTRGQCLTIPYSQYSLCLQTDGNLVLYENGVAWWWSGTQGTAASRLIMQGDGNLALYDDAWHYVWGTQTQSANASLTFGTDGNLVITSATGQTIWSTGTSNVTATEKWAMRTYWRDSRDRIYAFSKGSDASVNPMENGRGDHFWYDAEGQLTDAKYQGLTPLTTPSGWQREEHFQYDQLGNRKQVARYGSALQQWTRRDNGLNQIKDTPPWAGWVTYEDNYAPHAPGLNNGNLVTDGYLAANYNGLNQPLWIYGNARAAGNPLNFAHDPLGRCVKRWDNFSTTYLYYDGWNLIEEGPSSMQPQRQYIHGARVDEIVWSNIVLTGAQAFHHYDARTHCMMLTGPTQNIIEQYDYDAFGRVYAYNGAGAALTVSGRPGSPYGNRFLFTGREWLWDLGVYDYRHRHYNPELGRFLQPDPKHFEAGDYNIYRYCHNDPINKIDKDGLLTILITVYSSGLGSHSALLIVPSNGKAWLYDPAGNTYLAANTRKGLHNPERQFVGGDANLQAYIKAYHKSNDTVQLVGIDTSEVQERAIRKVAEEQSSRGGVGAGFCGSATAECLNSVGVQGIGNNYCWPGSIHDDALKGGGRPLPLNWKRSDGLPKSDEDPNAHAPWYRR